MKEYHVVYVDITNNGIPFYCGQGNYTRLKYLRRNKKHSNIAKKYGLNRLIVHETEHLYEALFMEIYWIKNLHLFVSDPETHKLACNFTTGGDFCKLSQFSKEKMSKSSKKRVENNTHHLLSGNIQKEWWKNISNEELKKRSQRLCNFNKNHEFIKRNSERLKGNQYGKNKKRTIQQRKTQSLRMKDGKLSNETKRIISMKTKIYFVKQKFTNGKLLNEWDIKLLRGEGLLPW